MGFEQNEHRVKKLISDLETVVGNFVREGQKGNKDARDEVTNLITATSFVFAKEISIIIKDSPEHIKQLDEYISSCRDVVLQIYNLDKGIVNETESNKAEFNNENLH